MLACTLGVNTPNFIIILKILNISVSVLILSVRGALVRKFMLSAHDLGMTKGDWTFLDVEIFKVRIEFT